VAHIADSVAGAVGVLGGFVSGDYRDFALGRGEQAGEYAEECRFTRAVFAEQDVALARSEVDADLAECCEATEEAGDGLEAS